VGDVIFERCSQVKMAFLEFEPHITFGEARLKMWFLAEAQRSPVKMGISHRCPCFDLNINLHECCKRKGWIPIATRLPCTPADSKRASYPKSTLGALIGLDRPLQEGSAENRTFGAFHARIGHIHAGSRY